MSKFSEEVCSELVSRFPSSWSVTDSTTDNSLFVLIIPPITELEIELTHSDINFVAVAVAPNYRNEVRHNNIEIVSEQVKSIVYNY